MALVNRCWFRAASNGAGNFVVSSALTGYYTPAQCANPAVVNGAQYSYAADSDDLLQHEEGVAAYDAGTSTLQRTTGTVYSSTNAGAIVNFTAAPRVMLTALQEDFASASPGGANTNIQFNDGGLFGGVSTFTFDKTTNTVTIGVEGAVSTFRTPDAVSADTAGASLAINAGAGTVGDSIGGGILLTSGMGVGASRGGHIDIIAANGGDSGQGGHLFFTSGDAGAAGNESAGFLRFSGGVGAGSGTGANVELLAGAGGSTGGGGAVVVGAGNGGGASGKGGPVSITAGNGGGGDSDAGNIMLTPGVASGAGVSGNIFISTLDTDSAAPAISGVTKMVICDDAGALSFTDRPPTIEIVQATAQTADIAATSFTTNAPGLYRLSYYLVDSAADITAGTVKATFTYTDAAAGQTVNSASIALITLGAFTQGTLFIQLASGNIQYATSHTGIFGTASYNLYMSLEKLG